jgi:8-oxo-dGTP pyrophosphatase MutT (NUDIX family)
VGRSCAKKQDTYPLAACMKRHTRYQGAIVQDDKLLLIKAVELATSELYYLIPGGGREDGESEAACVQREMLEETHLQVLVERLLLEMGAFPGDQTYQRYRTYLCRVVGGEASPGWEPEDAAAPLSTMLEIGWFDLNNPEGWDPLLVSTPYTYPQVLLIREALYGRSDS